MRFLVDEDLPRAVTRLFRGAGFFVEDVRDVGLRGASDQEVLEYAKQRDLAILTADLDFADIRSYPPTEYAGLIVAKLPSRAPSPAHPVALAHDEAQKEKDHYPDRPRDVGVAVAQATPESSLGREPW